MNNCKEDVHEYRLIELKVSICPKSGRKKFSKKSAKCWLISVGAFQKNTIIVIAVSDSLFPKGLEVFLDIDHQPLFHSEHDDMVVFLEYGVVMDFNDLLVSY